jgi:hypothetical protein
MTDNEDVMQRHAVVIGAMRCGTTTLFHLLHQIPAVCQTRIKECDYFVAEKSFYRGADWYRGLFSEPQKLCFDISPNYAKNDVFPGVAERMAAFNPNARIVYIVRDPVKRAVSEYHHQKAAGVNMPAPAQLLDSPEGRHIVSTSSYGKQLADYLKVFATDQILVVDMDDFVSDPQTSVAEILTFCGETSPPPTLHMSVENDRSAVERTPKLWLAIRRTRLGDRIRDLIPPALHKSVKSTVTKIFGRRGNSEPVEAFDAAVLEDLRNTLRDDIADFRQMTGRQFAQWAI